MSSVVNADEAAPTDHAAAQAAVAVAAAALTRGLAGELAPHLAPHIGVNGISAGIIHSGVARRLPSTDPHGVNDQSLLRRLGRPEGIVDAAARQVSIAAVSVPGEIPAGSAGRPRSP